MITSNVMGTFLPSNLYYTVYSNCACAPNVGISSEEMADDACDGLAGRGGVCVILPLLLQPYRVSMNYESKISDIVFEVLVGLS